MEEQKIKNLEEEFKVLKNQIRAVLLDIKEQLATGVNGQSGAPPWGSISAAIPQAENDIKVVPETPSGGPGFAEKGSSAGIAERTEPDLDPVMNRSGVPGVAVRNADSEGRVDLLTVSAPCLQMRQPGPAIATAQIRSAGPPAPRCRRSSRQHLALRCGSSQGRGQAQFLRQSRRSNLFPRIRARQREAQVQL